MWYCIPPSDDLARILMDTKPRTAWWTVEPVRLNRQFGRRDRVRRKGNVEHTSTAEGLE